jgi:hypothetical protein
MITIRRQTAVEAEMPALRKRFTNLCTACAYLRSPSRVNFHEHAPGTFSLVREHEEKVGPSGIVYGLREHPACQSLDVQIFDGYQTVLINNLARFLMMKVAALIADVIVEPLKQQYSFASAVRSFRSASDASLQTSQFHLCGSEPARILNRGAIAQGGEGAQSNVDADCVRTESQRTRFALDSEQREPASSLALDSERPYGARQVACELKPYQSYLGDSNLGTVKPSVHLSESKTAIAPSRSESRVSRFITYTHTLEERLKRQVNALQNILQRTRAHFRNVRPDRANIFQLIILIKPANAFALKTPCVTPFLESSVIEFRANPKMGFQRGCLFASRVDPVAKSLYHEGLILSWMAA